MTQPDRGPSASARDRVASAPVVGILAPLIVGVLVLTALATVSANAIAGDVAASLPLPLFSGALGFGTTAAVLLRRRRDLVGGISALASLGCAASALAVGAAPPTDGPSAAALVAQTLWMPGTLIAVSVLGVAVVSPRRRLVAVGVATSLLLWGATVADVLRAWPWSDAVLAVSTAAWVAVALLGGAALVRSWATHAGALRDASAWLGIAQWSVLLSAAPGHMETPGAEIAVTLAATILPAAIVLLSAALLLTDLTRDGAPVDVSLARILCWVLLGLALLVGYFAIARTVADVAPLTPTTAGMFAVAGLALSIEPARRWIQHAVDRLAYGRSAEPRALVRALGDELASFSSEDAETGPDVLANIARALREALRLVSVEIASMAPGGAAVLSGTPVANARTLRIVLPGPEGAAGMLSVTGAGNGTVDRRTRRLLHAISGVLALAVRLDDMNRDIDRARAQVLDMASQEQRLVRSELIDGVGAGVRSARERVARARDRVIEAPREAARLLDESALSLHDVTREVRDLARTLLPGALDAGDAVGALGELARRFDSPTIVIEVDEDTPTADATGMSLAYHLLAEAVLSARRDVGVDALRIRVATEASATRVIVRIDGRDASSRRAALRLVERARDAAATASLDTDDADVVVVVVIAS